MEKLLNTETAIHPILLERLDSNTSLGVFVVEIQ